MKAPMKKCSELGKPYVDDRFADVLESVLSQLKCTLLEEHGRVLELNHGSHNRSCIPQPYADCSEPDVSPLKESASPDVSPLKESVPPDIEHGKSNKLSCMLGQIVLPGN